MKYLFSLAIMVFLFSSCKKEEGVEGLQTISSLTQFQQETNQGVSFVFYHNTWCSICQAQRPAVTEVAMDEDLQTVYFGEVEYDEHQDIINANNIAGFPIMVIYVDGQEVERFNGGGHSAADFKTAIQAHL